MEQGGGLAVYSSQALLSKAEKPAFELRTEGIAVRSLVPNPEVQHLIAVVLSNGHLMIANLQDRSFARGVNGIASLKDGVVCVAWSVRGKQLVAGLQNGSAVQIDPTGAIKAAIPRAPDAPSDQTISSVLWLGNDDFFLIYSTQSPEPDTPPESTFYWLRTEKGRTKFEFRKAMDPSFAVHTRSPVAHFLTRIRKWDQLEDVIFTASTASSDIGTVTNSQTALTATADPTEITNLYTVTTMEDDTRRATLPMSLDKDDLQDTFPIGLALDLSSKDKVYQPIPGDDTITGDSPTPLPALLALNQEGILSYWWFINDFAVRKGDACPGLVAEGSSQPASFPAATVASPQQRASPFTSVSSPPANSTPFATVSSPQAASSPFAAPKLNLGGGFAKPAAPAFGQSAFGQKPAAPAFGGTSALGNSQSPWSTGAKPAGPAFGQPAGPAFGQPAFGKPAFGAPSAIGGSAFGASNNSAQNASPWGTSSTTTNPSTIPTSPFGAMAGATSGFAKLGQSNASPFGGMGGGKSASPFGGLGGGTTASPFGQSPATGNTPFQSFGSTVSIDSNTGGSTVTGQSVFGSSTFPSLTSTPQTSSMFQAQRAPDQGMAQGNGPTSAFGAPFKVGSTFAPASSAKELDMEDEPSKPVGGIPGLDLGSLGQDLSTPTIKEDPDAPKKGLFEFPSAKDPRTSASQSPSGFNRPEGSPDIQKSIEDTPQPTPEPPQVTSKPIPSPLTTAPSSASNSLQSSSVVEKGPEVDQAVEESPEPSLPPSEVSEAADDDDEDDEENEPPQSPQISEPESVASTPPRGELESPELTAQSILGSEGPPSWKDKLTHTPLVSSPLAPKSVAGLRNQPQLDSFGSSPGIPPPAPTPPVISSRPRPGGLFGSGISNSTTPQGMPQPAFKFPPPNHQGSPRSPSPVRQPMNGTGISVKPFQVKQAEPEPDDTIQTLSEVPETPTTEAFISSLRDKDHDYIKEQVLGRSPSPNLKLPPFISSHRDHDAVPGAPASDAEELGGLATNIERVYKDVNSMIDTLGMNARALSGFIHSHEVFAESEDKENHIDRSAELLRLLEPDDDDNSSEVKFCLDDLERFSFVEARLDERLTSEKTLGLIKIIGQAGTLGGETRMLKSDVKKMRTFLAAKRQQVGAKEGSPSKKKNTTLAPIPMDPAWATLQRNLRTKLATLRSQLADAEEKLTVTRAKVAAKSAGAKGRGPTAEAVEATVRRMTAMAEKRSGDIDVLEMQMKKLGLIGKHKHKKSVDVGRTFGLENAEESEEEEVSVQELEMRERVRRCVDVRRRRRQVLEKLRDELWKAQGLVQ
jgi:nucleoporin NUP159